jgi:drug/metabolite transporter (DMT)-like permease
VIDPLQATAWNFTYSLPIAVAALLLIPDAQATTPSGVLLAIVSGAVTSGLGYALWYSVLPRLGATIGAMSQLSVPVIALVLGSLLLSEDISLKGVIASALVLGGIGVGIFGTGMKK